MAAETQGGALWGGRFAHGPAPEMSALSQSTHFDWVLAAYDLTGSIAHATALLSAGLLSAEEHKTLVTELRRLRDSVQQGQLAPDPEDEDVHGALERMLVVNLGPELGGKLRAGRSRNDQIATLIRLYLRDHSREIQVLLAELAGALAAVASEHAHSVMPGRTHLQHAQPIVFGHHLLAHAWPLVRNIERLQGLDSRLVLSPYGAGALAGSTLKLDAMAVAKELGFEGPTENSLDATASRDLVAEALYVCAQIGVDVSRLAEDIILWSTNEFGYVRLDDRYSTGSSIMPQKKNPDIAELTRGKTGRLIGNLTGLLATLKALPLAYNRDLQEDKEPLFDSVETLLLVLPALRGLVETLTIDKDALAAKAAEGFSLATDIAEWLVTKGVPFRDAHEITGAVVSWCEDHQKTLHELSAEDLAAISPHLDHQMVQGLNVVSSVAARDGHGGTAPARVLEQHKALLAKLAALRVS
jgi:argininosuccinate lyase